MPKTERDFIIGMRNAGEESAAQKILLIVDKIKEVFGNALFVLTPSYQELLLKIHSSRQMLFRIKGEAAAALDATIDKIGTSLSTAVSSAGTAKATAVSQAINVLTAVSSIGFVLYEYKQKKLETLSEISFLDNVLKSHIYIDLLKRYLIKNKDKYLSDAAMAIVDLTSSDVVMAIIKEVIRDFAEEVAVSLYMRHEFLLEKLSNKGLKDLLDFFKESIAHHAEYEPAVLLTYGEPVECLLRATFPTINSKLFFTDKKKKYTRRLERLQPTDQDQGYTIGHYLHFTNRFEIDLSGLEPNIAFTGVRLFGRNHLPMVRTSKVKLKYHEANMASYPEIVLFQPETALSPTEYMELPPINPNITLIRRTVSTYLMYSTINAINEKLLELNKMQLLVSPIPGATPIATKLEQALALTDRLATKLSNQAPSIAREADAIIPTVIPFIATATSFTQVLTAVAQPIPDGVNRAKMALENAIVAGLHLTPEVIAEARELLLAITGAGDIPESVVIAARYLMTAITAAPQIAATVVTTAHALIRAINLTINHMPDTVITATGTLIQAILTAIPNVPPAVIAAGNVLIQAFGVSTAPSLRAPNIVAIANVMQQILVAIEKIPHATALQEVYASLEVMTAANALGRELNVPELTLPEEHHLSQLVNIAKTEVRWLENTLRLPISPLELRALTVRVATLQATLKIAVVKSMLKEKLDYNTPQLGYLREALGLVEQRAAILNVVAQQVTALNVAMNAVARTRGTNQVALGNPPQPAPAAIPQPQLLNITQLELDKTLPVTLLRVVPPAQPGPVQPTVLTQVQLEAMQQIATQQVTALNAAIDSALKVVSLPASQTVENSVLQVAALETNLQAAAKQANALVGILKEALQTTDTQVAIMQEALEEITRQVIKLQECLHDLELPVTPDISIDNVAFKNIVVLHTQAKVLEKHVKALKELALFNPKGLPPVPSINLEGLDPDCASDDESTATIESLEDKRRIVLTKQARTEGLTIMYRAKAERLASRIQRRQQEASTSGAAPSASAGSNARS